MKKDILNLQDEIIKSLSSKLIKQFDDYIIEGLKNKGFEFNSQLELHDFIKKRCRCEDSPHVKERVYFVDDIPFFLHKYETIYDFKTTTKDNSTFVTANYGSFAYL